MGRPAYEEPSEDDGSGDEVRRPLRGNRKRAGIVEDEGVQNDSPAMPSTSKRRSDTVTPHKSSPFAHRDGHGGSPPSPSGPAHRIRLVSRANPDQARKVVGELMRPATPRGERNSGATAAPAAAAAGRGRGDKLRGCNGAVAEDEGDDSHDIDVVGGHSEAEEENNEEEGEWEPESPTALQEKDYRHEEAFPQLHTKRALTLIHIEKKNRKGGSGDLELAEGNIPSYLSRTVDLSHVPAPSFSDVVESPVLKDLVTPKKAQGSAKKDRDRLEGADPFHVESSGKDHTSPYQLFILPSASHYDHIVEYDMDEQDISWLNLYNQERKNHDLPEISEDVFELLIDRIEKEWYSNSQTQKSKTELASEVMNEDHPCDICQQMEGEVGNAIVFCDGCNLAVHQDCYGVPYIPEGPWVCRKCFLLPEKNIKCIFCPNEGGAMKQTMDQRWAHILCAAWIPEVGFANAVYLEPVDSINAIPKDRWKLVCFICKSRVGACIQCSNPSCATAYHITCARKAGLFHTMKGVNKSTGEFISYCDRHSPKLPRSQTTSPEKRTSSVSSFATELPPYLMDSTPPVKKKSDAWSKKKPPERLPIIPTHIFHRLINSVNQFQIQKKIQFVATVCKYWSLKRQHRRGVPLLKRLHIQPHSWRSMVVANLTPTQLRVKHKHLWGLRDNLEKARAILDAVCKREAFKMQQLRVHYNVVNLVSNPLDSMLTKLLETIQAIDKKRIFALPVSEADVPDYAFFVKNPMDFSTIRQKLKDGKYQKWAAFAEDIRLIWKNATIYNAPETIFYKAAAKLQVQTEPLLEQASKVVEESRLDPDTGFLIDPLPPWYFAKNQLWPPGKLRLDPARPFGASDLCREKEREKDALPEANGNGNGVHPFLSYLDFGQKVEAKWSNGQYYAATVCLINREQNTVQVVFDDGLVEHVSFNDIKIIPSELIVSGSVRRLRSVDAKLEEEMKSITSPKSRTTTTPSSVSSPRSRPSSSSSSSRPLSSSSSSPSGAARPKSSSSSFWNSRGPSAPKLTIKKPLTQAKLNPLPTPLASRKTLMGRTVVTGRPMFVYNKASKPPLSPTIISRKSLKQSGRSVVDRVQTLVLPPRLPNGRFVKMTDQEKADAKAAASRLAPASTPSTPKGAQPARQAKTPTLLTSPPAKERSPGTWVWGKKDVHGVETWFPAEIVDPRTPSLPHSLVKDHKDMESKGLVLLSFIEKGGKRTFAWHSAKFALNFGHRRSVVRRLKKVDQYVKDLVMDAYNEALKHAPYQAEEGDDEEDEDEGV